MPKTDIKKIESEDVSELSDEALDRAKNMLTCFTGGTPTPCGSSSPSD